MIWTHDQWTYRICKFMKEHDWSINTAATAVPLTAHLPLWWQSAIGPFSKWLALAFAESCTLSKYFPSSYALFFVFIVLPLQPLWLIILIYVFIFSPSPPIDSIWAVVLVWRIRCKIIRTALCCVVYNSCAQWYAHTCAQFLHRFRFLLVCLLRFCLLCVVSW